MTSLFQTIVDLAKLGNLGVGLAILLMGFFLAFQTKPVDSATAKLRGNFLKFGFIYAVFTAVIGLAPLFISSGPLSLRLYFSPDFKTAKLDPPVIKLPDGTEAPHDAKFALQPSPGTQVVTITMDATLNEVLNLQAATESLNSALLKVASQRDVLAQKAAVAQTPAVTQTPAVSQAPNALESLQKNSASVGSIQADVAASLRAGNFSRASHLAAQLQSSVNAASKPVQVIAKSQSVPQH